MKFTLLALLVLVVVLAVLYEVDGAPKKGPKKAKVPARKPAKNKGRPKNKSPPKVVNEPGNKYSWEYVVDETSNITISAFVRTQSDLAVINTGDKDFKHVNFTKALISYDFTNSSSLVVIVPLQIIYPCFIVTTNLTFSQVKEKIVAYNGPVLDRLPEVEVDGTSAPLPPKEVKALYESNRVTQKICRGRSIIRTATTAVDPAKPNTTKISVIGLDYEYTITIVPPKRPPPPKVGKVKKGGKAKAKGGRG